MIIPYMEDVERLGGQLSIEIGCGVRYPAYGKLLFECRHGVIFPKFVVAQEDWDYMREKHKIESRMAG